MSIEREIEEYEKEWQEYEKIANKIHTEYKKNYTKLKDICKENNMQVEDFLYILGYQDVEEYLKEVEKRMSRKEEIENSIENKYTKFHNSDTYELTIEEAKYILLEDKGFRDVVNCAATKTLLHKIDQLEADNKTLIQTNKSYKGMINKQNQDKQKLIKKLKEDKMEELDYYTINLIESYLEIMKGEKE